MPSPDLARLEMRVLNKYQNRKWILRDYNNNNGKPFYDNFN